LRKKEKTSTRKHFTSLSLSSLLCLLSSISPTPIFSPARDPETCRAHQRPRPGAPFLFVCKKNRERKREIELGKPGDRIDALSQSLNPENKLRNSRLPPGLSASLARPSSAASKPGSAFGESRRGSHVATGSAPNSKTSRRIETGAGRRSPPHESAAAILMSTSLLASAVTPLGSTCMVVLCPMRPHPPTEQSGRGVWHKKGEASGGDSLSFPPGLATGALFFSLLPLFSDTPSLPDEGSSSETRRRRLWRLCLPF
jgi:hypothetical protein